MFSTVNLAFALFGAVGVWMILSSLTTWFSYLSLPVRRKGVNLSASAQTIAGDSDAQLHIFQHQPFFQRLFAPLLADLTRSLMPFMGNASQVQRQLLQAGRPEPFQTVTDFMAWKIVMALVCFVLGLVLALVFGGAALVLPLSLGLAALGYFLPNRQLSALIRSRNDELAHEMAFVLDRIAILLSSGMTLPLALTRISQTDEGGWFIAEVQQVIAEYNLGTPIEQGLMNMVRRNPDTPELERLVGRIAMSAAGLGLIEALVVMATLARERLEQLLLARARENSIKMLLPVGVCMLPAMFIALLAPGVLNIINALR